MFILVLLIFWDRLPPMFFIFTCHLHLSNKLLMLPSIIARRSQALIKAEGKFVENSLIILFLFFFFLFFYFSILSLICRMYRSNTFQMNSNVFYCHFFIFSDLLFRRISEIRILLLNQGNKGRKMLSVVRIRLSETLSMMNVPKHSRTFGWNRKIKVT